MNPRQFLPIVTAFVVIVSMAVAPGLGVVSATDPGEQVESPDLPSNQSIEHPPPATNSTLRNLGPSPQGDGMVSVVISTEGEVTQERITQLQAEGATIQSEFRNQVQATIPLNDLGVYQNIPWIENIRRPYQAASAAANTTSATPQAAGGGVEVIRADEVHEAGITGENVSVGVLAVTGFNLHSDEIRNNIADYKSFTRDINNGGDDTHGTGVAEIVVDVAPDSDLYLANFDTGVEYANAADWMVQQEVDVIVMSVSFFQQPYDGTGFISEVAQSAVQSGSVWANSAGNYAQDHWQGTYTDGDGDRWHNFGYSDEKNYLAEGRTLSAGENVWITLNWKGWPESDDNYDLYLYRDVDGGEDEVVAQSTRNQDGNDEPWEVIQTQISQSGQYYVGIRDSGAAPREMEMIFVSGQAPEHHDPEGSVTAPAVAPGVMSIGAFYHENLEMESFSSMGPTNDGRLGVSVAAPDGVWTQAYGGSFYGTSAAAPHAAGVAALVADANTGLTPSEVRDTMETTAIDAAAAGPDYKAGHGRVDAMASVQNVMEDIPPLNGYANPPMDPDGDGLYEDINGDGTVTVVDVQAFFKNYDGEIIQSHPAAFDFNGDGTVDIVDVQAVFAEVG